MNGSIIRYILGNVLKLESMFLLFPSVTALIYQEKEGAWYVMISLLCLLLGIIFTRRKPENYVFYLKEGCMITSLSWIVLSLFGCLPLWATGEIPCFIDALFETVSGFTTTGASILKNVEALSHCSLMWRSFTHWIGGMGVLVFLLAIVPMSGGSHINLMRAESPGPSVGKLVPKVRSTARILYFIYFGMTIIQIVVLILAKMPVFEAINTGLSTAGTGGFGFRNDSMASYSSGIQWIVTIFMILFGINFNAYYYLIFKHFRKAFGMEEVKGYLGVIFVAIVIISADLVQNSKNLFRSVTDASFQVASVITTTGFSTTDFNLWSQTSKLVIVVLMFIGACAGSTGGGIKVSRFIILIKTVIKELNSYIHPKSIKKIKIEGKPVPHEVVRSVNVYFITFVLLFSGSVLVISFDGYDLVTNFTAVAATINNIGPGLELVGPTQNFSLFSHFSKIVLMFDMLAGRLELFPLLILFHPEIWKDMFTKRVDKKKES